MSNMRVMNDAGTSSVSGLHLFIGRVWWESGRSPARRCRHPSIYRKMHVKPFSPLLSSRGQTPSSST